MNVTVYLGAHEGNNPVYKQAVAELATWIAQNGHRLVYGGSDEGLMAVIADTVLEQGGEVTGIEAQMFVDAQGIGGSVRSFLFDRFFKKTGTPKRPS